MHGVFTSSEECRQTFVKAFDDWSSKMLKIAIPSLILYTLNILRIFQMPLIFKTN